VFYGYFLLLVYYCLLVCFHCSKACLLSVSLAARRLGASFFFVLRLLFAILDPYCSAFWRLHNAPPPPPPPGPAIRLLAKTQKSASLFPPLMCYFSPPPPPPLTNPASARKAAQSPAVLLLRFFAELFSPVCTLAPPNRGPSQSNRLFQAPRLS